VSKSVAVTCPRTVSICADAGKRLAVKVIIANKNKM
jgi:hypothetical protein